MGSISRYIFRTTFGAFLVVLVSLTAVIWVTQALHDIDLMTSQGQTILVFVGITGLIIPLLILVIAPIALLIAVAHVLNKLSTDSEIIVMNAAGMSPWLLFRAFLSVAVVVSIVVTAISAYFAPKGLRMLREWLTEVQRRCGDQYRAARPLHLDRERRHHPHPRAAQQRPAGRHLPRRPARSGASASPSRGGRRVASTTTKAPSWSCKTAWCSASRPTQARSRHGGVRPLRLRPLARSPPARRRSNIRSASAISGSCCFPIRRTRSIVEQPDQFRAELHDRLIAPIYPLAFAVIAFAYLGAPRTNRQSRTVSMLGAVGGVALLRLIGFVSTVFGATMPWMLSLQYVALAIAFGGGLYVIRSGLILEPPAFIDNWLTALTERMTRRVATP